MPKLNPVGYVELAKKLRRAGYIPVRKNKHTIYFHPLKQITIPISHKHPRDISKGLLNKFVKEMKMTKEKFNSL